MDGGSPPIPNANCGTVQFALTVPTVLDRLIQQAVMQVLQPVVDPEFSRAQLRFPTGPQCTSGGTSERKAISAEGRRVVVDLDLEKFFDRVNHDILMAGSRRGRRWAGIEADPTLSGSGVMMDEVVISAWRDAAGGSAVPLLANILLDEVDRELERRGHRFVPLRR